MPELPEERRLNTQTATDRRRPGRLQTDNPHLIPLLRNPASVKPTPAEEAADRIAPAASDFSGCAEDDDSLVPARGITFGVLIGAAMWAMIGAAAWYLL